jgi:hypothetical protein
MGLCRLRPLCPSRAARALRFRPLRNELSNHANTMPRLVPLAKGQYIVQMIEASINVDHGKQQWCSIKGRQWPQS